jgi:hypothetical protein
MVFPPLLLKSSLILPLASIILFRKRKIWATDITKIGVSKSAEFFLALIPRNCESSFGHEIAEDMNGNILIDQLATLAIQQHVLFSAV